MMKCQTDEFLLGYLFNGTDRQLRRQQMGTDEIVGEVPTATVSIPTLWFGLAHVPQCSQPTPQMVAISTRCKWLVDRLAETIRDVMPSEEISCQFSREKQYMVFTTVAKPKRKKLTVKQLECILGYKIEVVDE